MTRVFGQNRPIPMLRFLTTICGLTLPAALLPLAGERHLLEAVVGRALVIAVAVADLGFRDALPLGPHQDSGEQPGGHREGITYFDHPSNPGHPTAWHVREDGWMGASACFAGPRTTSQQEPLTLRYLLHAHRGLIDSDRANAAFRAFAKRPGFELVKAPGKHTAYAARRK